MDTKQLYQDLYEQSGLYYGQFQQNMCPGARMFPDYRHWLIDPIIDLGCGTGDTVKVMRDNGHDADGIDQITINPEMQVGNICESMPPKLYRTAICLDVFEHIDDAGLHELCINMKLCEHQVITTFSGPVKYEGYDNDLIHCNIKTPDEWNEWISAYFNVHEMRIMGARRTMFLCSALWID